MTCEAFWAPCTSCVDQPAACACGIDARNHTDHLPPLPLPQDLVVAASAESKFIECAFAFALIWSVGGCIDGNGRTQFDALLRTLMDGKLPNQWDLGPSYNPEGPPPRMACTIPPAGLVYDYMFDKKVMHVPAHFNTTNTCLETNSISRPKVPHPT